nr:hypothetical protein [Tanacetum cinerariifolium]
MVAYLSKSDASAGFDQIVDILNAQAKDVVKLQALIDRKNVVITEDIICQDLRLDDVDGVDCLPTEEIFAELARMGYEKPPPKLTFYMAFFFAQWKFLSHTLVQCMSAKRTAWNEFSCSMASAIIFFATVLITNQVDDLSSYITKYTSPALTQKAAAEEEDVEDEVPAAPTPPSPTHETTPPLQAQPALPSSPPQEQPTTTSTSDMTLLHTLLETSITLSHRVAALEQDKVAQALEIYKLKKRVKRLEKKRRSKHSGLKRFRKERKEDDNAAIKEVNAAEPIVFNDEEVTMTMAQTLIKMKAKKARLLDEQMAKRLHDEEV